MGRLAACLLLMLLWPIWLVVFIAYSFVGHRNTIFRQKRIGLKKFPFDFYKFRTLNTDTDKMISDRQFPIGRLLRKTSLDELPQLWNIVKGDMCFVGPRPLPLEYLSYFSKEQKERFQVKPGLTGWAQVNGRTDVDWDTKLAYDIEYVQKQSFWMDLRILIKSAILVKRHIPRYKSKK